MGPSGAVLALSWPVLGHLGPSWGRLGPSWGRLGAILGRLGGVLGTSWAILGRLGGLLGASWAVLEASWGLLAAKTHQKPGGPEFWRPLGAVLASFFGGFWMAFGMNFQYFSYLILKDLNMS